MGVFILYISVSLGSYLVRHRADPLQQNVAEWGRNHNLGFAVNRLEKWLHSKPPSTKAATALALRPTFTSDPLNTDPVVATTDSVPADTTPVTGPSTSTPDAVTSIPGPTTIPASTVTPASTVIRAVSANPAPIAPVIQPALSGEGQWRTIFSLGSTPVVWATGVRPLSQYGSVVATAAVVEQSKLTAALFNGPLIPGHGPWTNGGRVMAAAVPSLVVTMNGGFRLEHIRGGYFAEGRVIKPLINDEATIGIKPDGSITVGVYGQDMTNDGTWTSLRQNLPPVVLNGKAAIGAYPGTYWGDDFHKVVFTFRSAICTRTDGRLMFVAVGKVDINLLADALVALGCQTAMELDINGDWPQFDTYTNFGSTQRSPILLDNRMGNPTRYLKSSDKDFIAFFDPKTLPTGILG